MTECSYRERVEARRAYEMRSLTSAVYAAAACLSVVVVGMSIFIAIYIGGVH